jgi:site-specific DNA recombinase
LHHERRERFARFKRNSKLEIMPEEADLVRKTFEGYLRLGSISAVAASLNAEGGKPKPRRLANGRIVAAACYRVGPLAHLLKNRFYIGEVVYRSDTHVGEQAPILDRALFDAVQARLKEQAVERSAVRSSSRSLLAGRIFDDRRNPMTPTHANKKGVRYRYYVSHALLQGQANQAGSVARISAPDVEALIVNGLRANSDADDNASDREIVDNHLGRAIVGRDQITITLGSGDLLDAANSQKDVPTIAVPFAATLPLRKGISHTPSRDQAMDEATRSALLMAIARSRGKADRSPTNKECPKRATRGCGRQCYNLPGYGCATSRNQRWRVGSTSASRATAGACASQRSWR